MMQNEISVGQLKRSHQ